MKLSAHLLPLLMLTCLLQAPAHGEELLARNSPFLASPSGQQSDASTAPAYVQQIMVPHDSWLETIDWWGYHGADSGGADYDRFIIRLDGVVQVGALTTSSVAGLTHYSYSLHFGHLLNASTLSIMNDSPDVEWYWQSTSAIGNPNAADGTQIAYALYGQPVAPPVDEPGMPLMLASGMLALALLGRRRAAAKD